MVERVTSSSSSVLCNDEVAGSIPSRGIHPAFHHSFVCFLFYFVIILYICFNLKPVFFCFILPEARAINVLLPSLFFGQEVE
jgi:hypothetical protein